MEERIKEIASRVLEWFSKGSTSPYECRISPTNNCNLACLPCVARGRPAYEAGKELSKEEYIGIIREACRIGVKRFDICGGGEPFCRKDVVDIMEEIKKHDVFGTISTNGTLISKEASKRIVEMEWDEVRFSVNGPNEGIDDYLRGVRGAFKKTINVIRIFTDLKEKLKKEKPHLILTPIITSKNYDKIIEFLELANTLKINTLILQPLMHEIVEDFTGIREETRRKIMEELKLSESQQKEFVRNLSKAKKLAEKYRINTNFDMLTFESIRHDTAELIKKESSNQENEILAIPCYTPWWDFDISTEGNVGPCPRAEKRINLRGRSVGEVWNSNYFNSFRKMLVNGKIPSICKSCCAISTFDNKKCREALVSMIKKHEGC